MSSTSNTMASTLINRRPLLRNYDSLSFGIITWAGLNTNMYGLEMYYKRSSIRVNKLFKEAPYERRTKLIVS